MIKLPGIAVILTITLVFDSSGSRTGIVARGRDAASRTLKARPDPASSSDPAVDDGGLSSSDEKVSETQLLTKVFGIERVPERQRTPHRPGEPQADTSFPASPSPPAAGHRAAPEYMTDLYNAVAYTDGISKAPSPYDADVVRGFTDKASNDEMRFYFNVSHQKNVDSVIEAELHLYKLRPRPQSPTSSSSTSRNIRIYDLRLYQVLHDGASIANKRSDVTRDDTQDGGAPDGDIQDGGVNGLLLLHQKRVVANRHGWEVFKVTDTVRNWVNSSQRNYGFLVTTTSIDGLQHVNGSVVRFAQRSEHHDSKQPVLIVFSNDTRSNNGRPSTDPDDVEDESYQPPSTSDSDLRALRTTYIRYQMNEEYRTSQQSSHLRSNDGATALQGSANVTLNAPMTTNKRRYYMSPIVHRLLVEDTARRPKRSARQTGGGTTGDTHVGGPSGLGYSSATRKRRRTCQRHEMYVDFEKIGWSGWIISPKGYNAYHCKGACPFPLGQNQRPSNHATVQSIVHALKIYPATTGGGAGGGAAALAAAPDVDTPCCVPNKLYSISLLYFDDDENVILKQYDEMVAASCGCH